MACDFFAGDVIGVSFFPYTHTDLNTENLLRQPYGSGSEAVFNFAANLYTLKNLRTLSSESPEKVNKAVYTLNIGESRIIDVQLLLHIHHSLLFVRLIEI